MSKAKMTAVAVLASAFLLVSVPSAVVAPSTVDRQGQTATIPENGQIDSQIMATAQEVGAYLAGELQKIEDSTWNKEAQKETKKFSVKQSKYLSKHSAQQLTTLASEQLGVDPGTLEKVPVTGSKVVIEDTRILSQGAEASTVEYIIRTTRDINGASDEEDWIEATPYEVTIDGRERITNILVKDDAYMIEQAVLATTP
ncbi:hypothetical protein [Glutamicibacter sp. X7]